MIEDPPFEEFTPEERERRIKRAYELLRLIYRETLAERQATSATGTVLSTNKRGTQAVLLPKSLLEGQQP